MEQYVTERIVCICIAVLCLGLRRVFQEAGLHEQVVAGHSLGELIGA